MFTKRVRRKWDGGGLMGHQDIPRVGILGEVNSGNEWVSRARRHLGLWKVTGLDSENQRAEALKVSECHKRNDSPLY